MGNAQLMHRTAWTAGQSTIELTFSMIIMVLLFLAITRFFLWAGEDLVERRRAHDAVLKMPCGDDAECPANQVRPKFFEYTDPKSFTAPTQ